MRRLAILAAVACILPVTGAHAASPSVVGMVADPYFPPNADSTHVFVIGDAIFGGEDPFTVGQDPSRDGDRPELGLFGMDARDIAIWQPDIEAAKLRFAMSVYDLQVIAPEAASWRWTFNVDGVPFELEAARGALTQPATLSAGPNAAAAAGDSFRLLGPCSNGDLGFQCPFYSLVEGKIDANADLISWSVPIEAPFRIGSTITGHPRGATTNAGVHGQTVKDRVEHRADKPYTVLDRRVDVWLRPATGGAPVTDIHAAILPTPQDPGVQPFWVNMDVTALPRGGIGPTTPYQAVARACAGTACSPLATFDIRL